MKTRLSPGLVRVRTLRRISFWTAMAVAAVLLVSLFVRAQRPPAAPTIAYENGLHAELAAGAPPKPAAPRVRPPKASPPAATGPSGLKLLPVTPDGGIKRVELLEKIAPEEGLLPASFTVPAPPPAAPATRPEPALGWGAWNQPAPEGTSGPGGIRQVPGLAPVLTASSHNPQGAAAVIPPAGSLPGESFGKASGWHHGHFQGGTLEAHQHGHASHKAHPRAGR